MHMVRTVPMNRKGKEKFEQVSIVSCRANLAHPFSKETICSCAVCLGLYSLESAALLQL